MMNKTLLSLAVVSMLMVGCSPKEVKPSVPVSVKQNDEHIEMLALTLKFNQAEAFQNNRQYAEAIKVYDSIIHYYRNKENKEILSLVYINKFECALLINQGYTKSDVEDFLRRFSDNPKHLMTFKVLYILDGAKRKSMDSEIERWSSTYKNRRFNGWTFKYIDDWITRMEDANTRNRLKRYVSIFKRFL